MRLGSVEPRAGNGGKRKNDHCLDSKLVARPANTSCQSLRTVLSRGITGIVAAFLRQRKMPNLQVEESKPDAKEQIGALQRPALTILNPSGHKIAYPSISYPE